MVDHEVDDDAGDADVEPEGERPAGDLAVLVEAFGPRAAEGDEDEWHDDDGEDGVGDEQSEVDGTNPALALEEDDLMDAVMVDEIGREEDARGDEGGDHEFFMEFALAGADGGVAADEKDGGEAVEGGVYGGVGEHWWAVTFRMTDR